MQTILVPVEIPYLQISICYMTVEIGNYLGDELGFTSEVEILPDEVSVVPGYYLLAAFRHCVPEWGSVPCLRERLPRAELRD